MHILTYKYVITFNKNDILYIVFCSLLFFLTLYHRYDMKMSPHINERHFFNCWIVFHCECTSLFNGWIVFHCKCTIYLTNCLLTGTWVIAIFFYSKQCFNEHLCTYVIGPCAKISVGQTLKRGISGLKDMCILQFNRSCQIVLWKAHPIFTHISNVWECWISALFVNWLLLILYLNPNI